MAAADDTAPMGDLTEAASGPVTAPEALAGVRCPLPLMDDAGEQTRTWTPPPHEWKVRLALLGFLCLLFLPNLGAFGLWDPWETHYGAVTTNMVETYDWVSPWWGYKEKIGTEPQQGEYFFSKPIFIFWSEATVCRFLGHGEWSIRLPMALLAIFAAFVVYLTASKLWSRRVGLLSAAILATSPQYFMISRQAQTDMPFVATMIVALCFFLLAVLGPRQRMTRRGFWAWMWGALAFVLLNTIPQYLVIATDLEATAPGDLTGLGWLGWRLQSVGSWQVSLYAIVLAAVVAGFGRSLWRDLRAEGLSEAVKDRWVRRAYLIGFYVMAAQSSYAKGLLGFMLPGAIIFCWMLVARSWRTIGRLEIIRGLLVFICVGFPWYVAMFAKHGMAYYQRFFIHDHFNRLGAGVHQIDSGTFEHFVKWLGFGMFPWAVFAPLAIVWLLRSTPRDGRADGQGRLFVSLWFVISFTLFTVSSTKFHHYIFPAMPALAVMVALFLDGLLEDRSWLPRFAAVVGVGLVAALGWDLRGDPQHIRNLMTYKYDRPMAEHLPIDPGAPVAEDSKVTWEESYFWKHSSPTLLTILTTKAFRYDIFISGLSVLGLLALGLFIAVRTRRVALVALGLMASLLAVWSLNYYMPTLSPHWSQKYLFDAYYDTCTLDENTEEVDEAYTPMLARIGLSSVSDYFRHQPKRVCREDVISWLITWRGETYYSYNELQPITTEQPQFMPYLEERNHGEKFYALMERGKMGAFASKLKSYSDKLKRKGVAGWTTIDDWEVRVEADESLYFQMVSATPIHAAKGGGQG